VFKLKAKTLAMLRLYLAKYESNQPFPHSEWIGKIWRKYRNRTARKLNEPHLRRIRLYDLRHYYATMTYHKTKDILYTKQQMGHKKIETTLLYTQLVYFNSEEYACKVARNLEEIVQLVK